MAGLTQAEVAAVAGISRSQVSRIERGRLPSVSYVTLTLVGAVVGLDLPLRAYPGSEPVRDVAQLALLSRFKTVLHPSVRSSDEVPLKVAGDRRAWDRVVTGRGWSIPVEAETRLRDVQALQRRVALKMRDDGVGRMILLVANTRHNRWVLRLHADAFAGAFPMPGREALAALKSGQCPAASAIVLL